MINPYEDSTAAWELYDAYMKLSKEPATEDPRADATDRMTAALYRIGAVLADSLEGISEGVFKMAGAVEDKDSN